MLISNQRMFLGAQGKVKKLNECFIAANFHEVHDCPALQLFPTLLRTCQATLGILNSVLVPATQKKMWTGWRGSREGP